jgi:hypothetical protein
MELDSSQGTRVSEPPLLDSIQDLVAFFVRYLELRLQLFGLESREAGFHLLVLALPFVSVLICFAGFVIMSVVFLLYLMMLILHWNGAGAIFGWFLSRIPARKKRVYIDTAPVKSRSNVGTRGRSASFGEKFGNSPNR